MTNTSCTSRKLMQIGMLLFLLGLLVGFGIPSFANPRMGLSAHLEGIMNGMFLVIAGLVWDHLQLSDRVKRATYFLLLYGAFANLTATTISAIWGAGGGMMPIAAPGMEAEMWKESVIKFLLISLSLCMVTALGFLVWGLRKIGENK